MKHELLAPAGNIEAGYAALHYGADAVYLGLTKFSARAGAENFTPDELDEFTAYAHSLHRKVFVAINTILTEAEAQELPEIFEVLACAKVDGLIIQDLGVFYLAKRLLPEVELHASTQMAVHNVEGARFLQSLGFKRVVLARELTLREIEEIATALPDLDLEVFVHGALCYSYSGQCLFSALEYGKSANRGRCVYPCRSIFEKSSKSVLNHGHSDRWMPHTQSSCTSMYTPVGRRTSDASTAINPTFSVHEDDDVIASKSKAARCSGVENNKKSECSKTHLFSMKDLALEEKVLKIPALSLKIEGRKKSPLYVAAVTNYYRHILDGKKKNSLEAEDIKQIFSRPWCQFHFNGKDKNITDENFVGHRGLIIGQVERVGKNRLGFKTNHTIARYDGIQIDVKGDEKPFGFGVKSLFVNAKSVISAKAGDYVEVELPTARPRLDTGAPIYLASSSETKGRYNYQKPKPNEFRNLISLDVTIEINEHEVWAMCGDTAVSVQGDFQKANDVNKVTESIKTAFAKTGGTPYHISDIVVHNPRRLFVPVSLLNNLRRSFLEEVLIEKREFVLPVLKQEKVVVDEPKQIIRFLLSLDTKSDDYKNVDMENTWFVLPQICRNTKLLASVVKDAYQHGARKFIAENYYAFELLKEYKNIEIGAGSFIYVMNKYAAAELKDIGASFATLALESSQDNMLEVINHTPLKLVQVVKTYPPLFTSAVCIRPYPCKECKGGVVTYQLGKDGRSYTAISHNCQVQVFNDKAYERTLLDGVWGKIEE